MYITVNTACNTHLEFFERSIFFNKENSLSNLSLIFISLQFVLSDFKFQFINVTSLKKALLSQDKVPVDIV